MKTLNSARRSLGAAIENRISVLDRTKAACGCVCIYASVCEYNAVSSENSERLEHRALKYDVATTVKRALFTQTRTFARE